MLPVSRPDHFGIVAAVYRERGWLGTIPLPAGQKHPPPVGWTGRNARHPDQDDIDAWLMKVKYKNANIGLHLGATPSGDYEVIGIDVDNYGDKHGGEQLARLERELGTLPPTYVSSSRPMPSGIRFYRVPVGYSFRGKAASAIEIIQRAHRYAVVWPSWNPDSDAQYGWRDPHGQIVSGLDDLPNVDELPVLSPDDPATDKWFSFLTQGGVRDPGPVPIDMDSTNTELEVWVESALPGAAKAPCERTAVVVDKWITAIEDDESSHDKITGAHWELVRLAVEGHHGLSTAMSAVGDAYVKDTVRRGKRGVDELRGEVTRSFWGALRKAKAELDGGDELPPRRALSDPCPPVIDEEAFWTARPVLIELRQFARSRMVGPWAMLGQVLARVSTTIPPEVVLPPLVGSYASLNQFVALVGPSGGGKGGAARAAADWLGTDPTPHVANPGSGEGMVKVYAHHSPKTGQVGVRTSALFEAAEVDVLAPLMNRSGSTLLPQLRSAWSGEQLGFAYADPSKAIRLCEHRYRLCLVVGVQPERAAALLDDADGGTPQRFVWLPTTDPTAPEELPVSPPRRDLPPWAAVSKGGLVVQDEVGPAQMLDLPTDTSELCVLIVPDEAERAVRDHRRAVVRGDRNVDPLDGHALQCRLKVAAALMVLDSRADEITIEDWELAGVVMRVSHRTRTAVRKTLATKIAAGNKARGRAEGQRAVHAENVRRVAAVRRVAENMLRKLRATDTDGLARINLRNKQIAQRDREYFEEAEELLIHEGKLEKLRTDGGHVLRLRDAQ